MRRAAVALVFAAVAAVPATADAENYLNSSSANGAHVVKSGRTISTFELFCKGNTDDYFDRQFAFSVRDIVELGRKGKFSYSGYAFRYGPERQPRGEVKVKLSGRLTSTAARVNWSLPGCGSGTVTAPRQKG